VSHKGLIAAASGNPGISDIPLKAAFGDGVGRNLETVQGAQEVFKTTGGIGDGFLRPFTLGQTDTRGP